MPPAILAYCANQLGGTFLAPASTLSIASLLVTLVIAIACLTHGRARRPRWHVIRRALFPSRITRSRSGRLDIAFFVFSLFGAGVAIGWALLSANAVRGIVAGALRHQFGLPEASAAPSLTVGIVATLVLFLAYELAYWLDHWLKHRVAFLWEFHKVHHSAESLSLLTNFRVHPVDTILFYNLVALVTGIAGALVEVTSGTRADVIGSGGTSLLTMLFAAGLTHLQHSHLWISLPGRWGRHVLSPAHHQIHHSADPHHFNRNFGNALALFDRLFGTLHAPAARREPLRFGLGPLDHDPHAPSNALVRPFVDAARGLLPAASSRAPLAAPARR